MLTGMPACGTSYKLQPLFCEQSFTLSRSAKRIDRKQRASNQPNVHTKRSGNKHWRTLRNCHLTEWYWRQIFKHVLNIAFKNLDYQSWLLTLLYKRAKASHSSHLTLSMRILCSLTEIPLGGGAASYRGARHRKTGIHGWVAILMKDLWPPLT